MADMLVRLWNLPPLESALERVRAHGLWVRRAEPWDRRKVVEFATQQFSANWGDEIQMAFGHHPLSLFVADDAEGSIQGFAAYHCTRLDYFGPEGVLEELRGKGLGAALLLSCLWAMSYEGYSYAIIGWAGPVEFYQKICGATVIEDSEPGTFWTLRRK
jgi:GNAT superfamily N-acetyltransferase